MEDLSYLRTEYGRQKMTESYNLEMREKEAKNGKDQVKIGSVADKSIVTEISFEQKTSKGFDTEAT